MQARLDLKARCWLLLYFKKNKSKNHLIESEKLLVEKIFSSFCEFFICKIKSSRKKKTFFLIRKNRKLFSLLRKIKSPRENSFFTNDLLNPVGKSLFLEWVYIFFDALYRMKNTKFNLFVKGALMQIWKSFYMFVLI